MARQIERHPEMAGTYEPIGVEEYLRLEEASPVRHEYVAGKLYAMVGASKRHNRIVFNLMLLIGPIANDRACSVWFSDVKLRAAEDVIYYPDLIISCDECDQDAYISTHPCVIVEVLSSTTAGTDRREKLLAYRRMESLQAYLIVHQDEQRVERHWRDEAGAWRSATIADDGVVPCPCVNVDIALADLYADLSPVEDNA